MPKEKITSVKLFRLNIRTKGIPHTVLYIIILHLAQIRTMARVLNPVLVHKRNPLVSLCSPEAQHHRGEPSIAPLHRHTCASHFLWPSRSIPQHPIVKFTRGEVCCIKVP